MFVVLIWDFGRWDGGSGVDLSAKLVLGLDSVDLDGTMY